MARSVSEFSPVEFKLLQFFHDPRAFLAAYNLPAPIIVGNLPRMLLEVIPELDGRKDRLNQIYSELIQRGFLKGGPLDVVMSPAGAMAKRTTYLGDQALTK